MDFRSGRHPWVNPRRGQRFELWGKPAACSNRCIAAASGGTTPARSPKSENLKDPERLGEALAHNR